jgi:hypothetical protein
MTARIYGRSPLTWDGKSPETVRNDCNWLESIVRNAAPLSDWWTKARIVQLAYPLPPGAKPTKTRGAPTYAGLSESEIVDTLRNTVDLAQYPDFAREVDENYVIKTLNAWKSQQFNQAISRNFEVYADRIHRNVFLVISTTPVSLGVDRVLPASDRFRPLFNVDEFARIIHSQNVQRLTLRTHGYANPASGFYDHLRAEADSLNSPTPAPNATTPPTALSANHFYVGYHWPSEQPVTSPGLWVDYLTAPGVVVKFLVSLAVVAGIVGSVLYLLLQFLIVPLLNWLGRWLLLAPLSQLSTITHWAVRWSWLIPAVFLLWLLLFLLLRIVVYQRDRYRAIHYGAPDLAEFFWRLDRAISNPDNWETPVPSNQPDRDRRMGVNLVGHSMGALVLVNVLRLLSNDYGREDKEIVKPDSVLTPGEDTADDIGEHLELDKLILASPDIPLEFLREGRNNYIRSAIRRCRRIYLLSSDRDIVLRYLATLGNWFSEPSIQMAGLRLGNVYLKQAAISQQSTQVTPVPETPTIPPYIPYVRILLHSEPAVKPTSSYDLFRKFNYLDCSQMSGAGKDGGVNSVPFKLNRFNGVLIDLINTTWFSLGTTLGINHLDVHGGYFQTKTRSFAIIKFLLTVDPQADDDLIKAKLEEQLQGSPIHFLPSQPWVMPKPDVAAK